MTSSSSFPAFDLNTVLLIKSRTTVSHHHLRLGTCHAILPEPHRATRHRKQLQPAQRLLLYPGTFSTRYTYPVSSRWSWTIYSRPRVHTTYSTSSEHDLVFITRFAGRWYRTIKALGLECSDCDSWGGCGRADTKETGGEEQEGETAKYCQ